MKPTTKELSKQIALLKKEGKRRSLAVKAGVCPECGAKLVQTVEKKLLYDPPHWFLFWTFPEYYFSHSNVCSANSSHYKAYAEPEGECDPIFDDDGAY